MTLTTDKFYMQQALDLAYVASCHNEVPVGAVIVKNGEVIAKGFNLCIQNSDPSAHAEIMAIRQAASELKNYRLEDCELYVTLEPCCMCAGTIINSRIKRVVYAASDLKAGAAGSVLNLFKNPIINHHTSIDKGVLKEESIALLQSFFQKKRLSNSQKAQSNKLREDFLRLPATIYSDYVKKNQIANFSHFNSQLSLLKGACLHYLDSGFSASNPVQLQLKTMVILPGLIQSTDSFIDVFHYFRNLGNRVIAIDLIGMGFSDKPKKLKHDSFEAMVNYHFQYLNELLLHLNITSFDIVTANLSAVIALAIQSSQDSTTIYLQNNLSSFKLSEIKSWNHYKKIIDSTDFLPSATMLCYPDKGHFRYTHGLLDWFCQSNWVNLLQNISIPSSESLIKDCNQQFNHTSPHQHELAHTLKLGKQSFLCLKQPAINQLTAFKALA